MTNELILKKNKWIKIRKILFIFLIMSIIIIGFMIGYRVSANGGGMKGLMATVLGHDEHTVEKLEKITVLIVGESDMLTDTILVVSYNPQTQNAKMISIPRDTFIGKNKYSAKASDKINSIHATYGIEELIKQVEKLTNTKINYYVKVNTQGLKELVDMIGGVDFYVPINMEYDDNKQNLHIHLEKGYQHLDGKKAEQLLRFRHNNNGTTYNQEYGDNDYGRMKTRKRVFKKSVK